MKRLTPILLAGPVLALVAACGSPQAPVGRVTVTPARIDLPHSGWQRVRLSWTMDAPLDGRQGELRVLAHLLGAGGEILRTFDHPFPHEWRPGGETGYELVVFQSALSDPLAAGEYPLAVGLYDGGGNRWTVTGGGGAAAGGPAATMIAGEPGADFPELYFSADWLPIEAGTDQQILARRWLGGDGVLRVGQITREGSLWVRLGVPTGSDLQDLVLAAGAARPAATIRADCSGFETVLEGSGSHTVEIPLTPAGDPPGECRVELEANFEMLSKVNEEKRTVVLENVAWAGAG